MEIGIPRPSLGSRLKLFHRVLQVSLLGQHPGFTEAQCALQFDGVDHGHRLRRVEVGRDLPDVGDQALDTSKVTHLDYVPKHVELPEVFAD